MSLNYLRVRVAETERKINKMASRAYAYKSNSSNWLEPTVGGALNSVSVNSSCKGIFSKG